jgi:hypothetical protein
MKSPWALVSGPAIEVQSTEAFELKQIPGQTLK